MVSITSRKCFTRKMELATLVQIMNDYPQNLNTMEADAAEVEKDPEQNQNSRVLPPMTPSRVSNYSSTRILTPRRLTPRTLQTISISQPSPTQRSLRLNTQSTVSGLSHDNENDPSARLKQFF